MAEPQTTNLDRLEKAGVADASQLNEREREFLETLTTDEVDTLIRIHDKLGPAPADAPYSWVRFPF
jgi:hypothetical protein